MGMYFDILFFYNFPMTIHQYFTLTTNSSNLKVLAGKETGSRQLKKLCKQSLTVSTPLSRLRRCQNLKWYVIHLSNVFYSWRNWPQSQRTYLTTFQHSNHPKNQCFEDDLDRYLSTNPEDVTDALEWWYEHKHIYPHLHHIALDYLSIPGKFFQWQVGDMSALLC